jgi:hypothetical protein
MSVGVVNGQLANQTSFNDGFMSRKDDTNTIGKIDLLNVLDTASGPTMLNIQRIVNSIASALGMTTGEVYNFLLTWTESYVGGTNPSTAKAKIQALANLFSGATGHAHTGVDGDAKKVSAFDLVNFNIFSAEWQKVSVGIASGIVSDITSEMSTKNFGGTSTQVGVITSAPFNKTVILKLPKNDQVEDAEGQIIYGRITYIGAQWLLNYYTNENGVETAYNFTVPTNIDCYFLEVFNSSTRPTIPSSPAMFGTLDVTADVIDATVLLRGLINTLTQIFAGNKTFTGITTVSNLANSTINTDGAFIVSGGVGIAKSLFIGMALDVLGSCFLGKTEVRDVTQSTDKDTGALVIQGGVGIEKNLNVGGDTILTGNLTVNGTATTLNTATLDVEDQNITVNVNGNDASAEGAGLTVNRTGIDGSLVYQDSLASKFKCGALGAESEILTAATNQTVTGEKLHTAKLTLQSQVVFDEQVDGASSGANVTLPTPSKFYYTITNGALTSISGVTALTKDAFLLVNKTGNTVVLKYDAGTIAADGLLNGAGSDIPMRDGSSLFFIYSPTAARWIIIGAFVSSENKNEAIAAAGSFSKPTGFSASYLVSSTGGEVDSSTTPLGTIAPPSDGTEVTFTGFHLINIVTFLTADIAKGFILNGDCRLPKYSTLTVKYILVLDRWVEKSRSQYGI